jgi:integrase
LPSMVGDVLAAHLEVNPAGPGGLLWHTSTGRPIDHDYYGGRVFPKAVAAAGLPEGTSSHDLRHHFASVLLAAGESVIAVSERLGHESAALVLSVYGHLMPDSEERTRKAIDAAWSADSGAATAQGRPG